MPVALPVPTLDHVVVNVRDEVEAELDTYRRLGFTMTPRGYHTLGSMNHLAILGTEYLELIAAAPGDTRRAEILAAPSGLNGLVFGTDDSAAVYAALRAAESSPSSAPGVLPAGEPAGRRARRGLPSPCACSPGTVSSGRIYFCHHFTRDLVWRDEWRHHPNGAIGVSRAVIAARDPNVLGTLFTRMFGEDAIRRNMSGYFTCRWTVAVRRSAAGRAGPTVRRCRAVVRRTRRVHGSPHDPDAVPGAHRRRARCRADCRRASAGRPHCRACCRSLRSRAGIPRVIVSASV